MDKKFLKLVVVLFAAGLASFAFGNIQQKDSPSQKGNEKAVRVESQPSAVQPTDPMVKEAENNSRSSENKAKDIPRKVPFVLQAPLGNWDDPIFQDGCEEASVVMAMGWVNKEEMISTQKALEQIKDMVEFENKTFGFNADTNLSDVQKIFSQYYSYGKTAIRENINSQDMIGELQKGNIILVPAFGQALKNPNFTQPGPVAHMLVVKGYDEKTGEFITNDPGTKRGESYRYKKDVLFDAIWQYPSGKGPLEIPKSKDMKKGMLVVEG